MIKERGYMSVQKTQTERGTLVPLLREIKSEQGTIPPAALQNLAHTLGVDYAKVHKVAAFYCRLDSVERELRLAS